MEAMLINKTWLIIQKAFLIVIWTIFMAFITVISYIFYAIIVPNKVKTLHQYLKRGYNQIVIKIVKT